MQVNASVPPSISKAEPFTSSVENPETPADGGFQVQMATIMGIKTDSVAQPEEKPARQDPVQGDSDPLTLLVSASVLPLSSPNCPAVTVDPEIPSERMLPILKVEMPNFKPGIAAKSGEHACNPGLPGIQTADSVKMGEIPAMTADTLKTVSDPQPDISPLIFKSLPELAKPVPLKKEAELTVPNPDSRSKSSRNSEAVSIDSEVTLAFEAQDLHSIRPVGTDSPQQNEEAPKSGSPDQVVLPAKAPGVAHAALENAGTNNSDSERKGLQSEFVSTIVQQNRPTEIEADVKQSKNGKAEVTMDMPTNSLRQTESAAPAAEMRPQSAVQRPRDFITELSDRIQIQVREGRGEIRVQLHPENLGHLEIRAESTVSGLVARIVAESGSVKNYLESNLHLLQQSLQDQGLKIDRIQVSVQDNGGSASFAGDSAQSNFAGPGNQGKGKAHQSDISGNAGITQPEELIAEPPAWFRPNPNSRFYTIA